MRTDSVENRRQPFSGRQRCQGSQRQTQSNPRTMKLLVCFHFIRKAASQLLSDLIEIGLRTRRGYAGEWSRIFSTNVKSVVLAPMPKPSVPMATTEKSGVRLNALTP